MCIHEPNENFIKRSFDLRKPEIFDKLCKLFLSDKVPLSEEAWFGYHFKKGVLFVKTVLGQTLQPVTNTAEASEWRGDPCRKCARRRHIGKTMQIILKLL